MTLPPDSSQAPRPGSRLLTLSLLLFLGLLPASMSAQNVITLTAAKDNTLYESSLGDLSNGSGEYLFAGTTNQGLGDAYRRTLIAFDLSTLPEGATVLSVELTLDMTQTIADTENVALHRLTTNWGEGTSDASGQEGRGAPPTSGDATWIHALWPGTLWTDPGGDFVSAASDVQPVGDLGQYTWSSANMTADVVGWLADPGTNFGWILVGDESFAPTAKRFASRETLVETPPRLRVTIVGDPAAIPAVTEVGLAAMILLLALVSVCRLRRRDPSVLRHL